MLHTSAEDFHILFNKLDIRRGDCIMVHSFTPSLGKIDGGLSTLYNSLLTILGKEGTIIVPTFTYSYCKNEIFNVNESKSTVGVFTELVRQQPEAIRSNDPIFSMVAIGNEASLLMTRSSKNCFGKGSIYERLHKRNTKFLLLGIDYNQGLTFSIHIEKMFGVKYRYDKVFKGITVNNDDCHEDSAIFFVRDFKINPKGARNKVGYQMDKLGLSKVAKLAYGTHRVVAAKDYFSYATECLKKDPFAMIESYG